MEYRMQKYKSVNCLKGIVWFKTYGYPAVIRKVRSRVSHLYSYLYYRMFHIWHSKNDVYSFLLDVKAILGQ